jgi:hypothetical protein
MNADLVQQIAPSTVAAIILTATALTKNAPDNYSRVGDIPLAYHIERKLDVLNICILIIAILQTAGYFFLIYCNFEQIQLIPYIGLLVGWVVIILTSSRLNKPQNAYNGGHFAIFFSLLLLGGGHLQSCANLLVFSIQVSIKQVIATSQFLILLILVSVIGFWTSRTEEDDEENISYEKGASIFSQLSFSWITPMVSKGASTTLKESDIWGLNDVDKSEHILAKYYAKR